MNAVESGERTIFVGQTPSGRLSHLFDRLGSWATPALCGRFGWTWGDASPRWDGDADGVCSQCVRAARR